METPQAITLLSTSIQNDSAQAGLISENSQAKQIALDLLNKGYQSDLAAIAKGIADGITAQLPDAVAAKTTELTAALQTEQTAHATDVGNLTNQLTTATNLQAAVLAALQDATQLDDTTRLNNALALLVPTPAQ